MKKLIAASAAALMLGGAIAPAAMAGPVRVRTNINLMLNNVTQVGVQTQVAVAVGCLAFCSGGSVNAGNFGIIIQDSTVVGVQG